MLCNAICLNLRQAGREEGGHRRVSQYCQQIMNSQDIPLEDIVLLQLFKDNLVSSSVEETPGVCDHHCPAALSEVSTGTASTDSDLSDLDSVLSQQVKIKQPGCLQYFVTKHQQL